MSPIEAFLFYVFGLISVSTYSLGLGYLLNLTVDEYKKDFQTMGWAELGAGIVVDTVVLLVWPFFAGVSLYKHFGPGKE